MQSDSVRGDGPLLGKRCDFRHSVNECILISTLNKTLYFQINNKYHKHLSVLRIVAGPFRGRLSAAHLQTCNCAVSYSQS